MNVWPVLIMWLNCARDISDSWKEVERLSMICATNVTHNLKKISSAGRYFLLAKYRRPASLELSS
ncbi:hypothetical protein KCP75_14080 [Salmonella enterica subsp. enterica]|nr:hypothetical protein KCP75_14080 [Salmonella enterica subsp. enterica]